MCCLYRGTRRVQSSDRNDIQHKWACDVGRSQNTVKGEKNEGNRGTRQGFKDSRQGSRKTRPIGRGYGFLSQYLLTGWVPEVSNRPLVWYIY